MTIHRGGHVLQKVLWHPAHLPYLTIHRGGGGGVMLSKKYCDIQPTYHFWPYIEGGGSCSPKGAVTSKFCLNHKMATLPITARCSDHKWTLHNYHKTLDARRATKTADRSPGPGAYPDFKAWITSRISGAWFCHIQKLVLASFSKLFFLQNLKGSLNRNLSCASPHKNAVRIKRFGKNNCWHNLSSRSRPS